MAEPELAVIAALLREVLVRLEDLETMISTIDLRTERIARTVGAETEEDAHD